MNTLLAEPLEGWTAADLSRDPGWALDLDDAARRDLESLALANGPHGLPRLDLTPAEVDLGRAAAPLAAGFGPLRRRYGFALIRGLPRARLTAEAFAGLLWAIGLHHGVARPQGSAATLLAAEPGGGSTPVPARPPASAPADLVLLGCWNAALSGGDCRLASGAALHRRLQDTAPDLAEALGAPLPLAYSGEVAPGEPAVLGCPVFGRAAERLIVHWDPARVARALGMAGTPALSPRQQAGMAAVTALLRRPGLLHAVLLQPGDLLVLDPHATLQGWGEWLDQPAPEQRRRINRLWLATADSPPLPEAWAGLFGSVAPGTLRGGSRVLADDAGRAAYAARQAAALGLRTDG